MKLNKLYESITIQFLYIIIKFAITYFIIQISILKYDNGCISLFSIKCSWLIWGSYFISILINLVRLFNIIFKPKIKISLIKNIQIKHLIIAFKGLFLVIIFLAISNPNMDKFKDYTYNEYDEKRDIDLDPHFTVIRTRVNNYIIFSKYQIQVNRISDGHVEGNELDETYVGIALNFYKN